jgi:hypothetical protein
VTTFLVVIFGGLWLWEQLRSTFRPYRWAWTFGIALGVCGVAESLFDLHLSRLPLALCVGWAVFACLGYITAHIDKAVSEMKEGNRTGSNKIEPVEEWPSDDEVDKNASSEDDEDFSLSYPTMSENSYHFAVVSPSKRTYQEEFSHSFSSQKAYYEYTLKGETQVFARLIDSFDEAILRSPRYKVVNGHVQRDVVRQEEHGRWSSKEDREYFTASALEQLDHDVLWHEVIGSLRYFILSKHGIRQYFFIGERERLQEGFAKLERAASKIGVKRDEYGWYSAPKDDELACQAMTRLLEDTKSDRYRIKLREFQDYEHIMKTLDELIASEERGIPLSRT